VDSLREVVGQLDRFGDQLRAGNPQLYRDLALYLQTLRAGLLNSVQQACFHLATRYYPERFCNLSSDQRQALRLQLVELVRRASSLLTVEQVAQLAGKLALEQEQQHRSRQREWLAQLRKSRDEAAAAELDDQEPSSVPQNGDEPEDLDVPYGSVQLDGALPPGLAALFQSLDQPEREPRSGNPDTRQQLAVALFQSRSPSSQDPPAGPAPQQDTGELEAELPPPQSGETGAVPPPWHEPCLPQDPLALLRWLDGFDAALSRRLRNLSHALNVELLRCGLTASLLPLNLLEAAVQGQLDPQPAPANLLRLQLPLGPASADPLESVVVLLRPADLELEAPRLRTCRSRWQRHREETRRMAEQYRRLKRRLQTLEAERLWHQDTPNPSPTPDQT
jgi:hypothetical protein